MLQNVNLEKKLPREDYNKLLPALQRRLFELEKACWDHGVSSILVFEGWETAGKGGCISALTQRLDPRGFKVYAINAPRTFEQKFPWLWRFWLKTPNRGEMVILDRSWYRRVLDERVSGVTSAEEARQAYADIVEFERTLYDDGVAILKFFLHISKKEQKKRIRKIEQNPLESWRTKEDEWHVHSRYDDFFEHADAALESTESDFAPWTIVEATSRWHARRKVFDIVIAALERRLGDRASGVEPDEQEGAPDDELRAAMHSLDEEEGDA